MFVRAFVTLIVAAAGVAGQAPAQQGATREGRVYVSVTDNAGKPLPLTAAEVSIKEDGRAREVLRVEKASGPVHIALLVDDSQAATGAINDMRLGLKQFVTKVLDANADSQIALITFGERPTLLTDYTNNRAQLDRGINRVFARQGAGAYMLEAIISAARGLIKREPPRSHIVIAATEGIEFSNDHYDRVLSELAESKASLWVLTLTSGPRAADTEEVRNRSVVVGRGTSNTGGKQDLVLANNALPGALDRIADTIFNQHVIVFGRPDALVPPKKIEVKVSTKGVKLLAPEYAPRVGK